MHLKNDKELAEVFTDKKILRIILDKLPNSRKNKNMKRNYRLVGIPVKLKNQRCSVCIYQSLQVPWKTTERTTDFIFLSAGIAIILTTFLHFFYLHESLHRFRKMREVAFEVARGKFDTKAPMCRRMKLVSWQLL